MNNSIKNENEADTLSLRDVIPLLWEWRKYRNGVFWGSVFRFGVIAIILTILPYLLPDLLEKLGYATLIFPFLSSLISCFGAYLMAVQYKLYKQVDKKFRSSLGKFDAEDIPEDKFINRIFRTSFGTIIVFFFLFFAIIIQAANCLILFALLQRI